MFVWICCFMGKRRFLRSKKHNNNQIIHSHIPTSLKMITVRRAEKKDLAAIQ